jgi:putative nucleotidyltransferase with HDIG domain
LHALDKRTHRYLKTYLKSKTFQRILIGIITIAVAFIIIENGAVPKKYRLNLGESSNYDITAPRDIENRQKTIELARAASDAVPPVMIRLDNVPIDTLNTVSEFFTVVEDARKSVEKSLQDQGITKKDKGYRQKLEVEQAIAANRLEEDIKKFAVPLSTEQVRYLVTKITDEELSQFKKLSMELIGSIMKEEVTEGNLVEKVYNAQSSFQKSEVSQDLKIIGGLLVKAVIKPNNLVDTDLTAKKKQEAYDTALENRQIIAEGSRILSFGDIVTEDKLEVLKELNLVETDRFDYAFAAGIMGLVLLLSAILVLYMNFFCKKILYNRNDLILLNVIILLTLVSSRIIHIYSPLLMPVFIAPMLISILLDLRLSIIVNMVLSLALSFITKGDMSFMCISFIGGTFAAFVVSRANQRSKLSAAGLGIAAVNAVVIAFLGLVSKSTPGSIANDAGIIAINGILSTILTIGILPFFESTFNIITPLKLLELANPNQPLIKRLLMEAPGTYHHSLMVGNLAEVATEAIEGNALLARVGAYYHDVGKLKRPNFFKENQLSDNPHDRMTPNLSTLVITSHTSDGVEIAEKYKIPLAIKEIISQHHGTTLAAYFYYKAKKGEKGENIKQEDFRYQGPRPTTKEAAVVMLADSVEAAVRSMVDKTEGKIEGLIRKIIKDKLDDGQLDLCELTLKDLDNIARAFLRVFGGYFHEREEYPDMKMKKLLAEEPKAEDVQSIYQQEPPEKPAEEEKATYETY